MPTTEVFKIKTKRKNLFLRVAKGHFATNHSHSNYYIDVAAQKSRLSEAKAVAQELCSNSNYKVNIVDTILCLDGTEVIGACLADSLSKADFVTLASGIAFDKITVKEIMSKDVKYVSPTERLIHARRVMLESNVGRLPVLDDNELVGMITSKDLMRAFIDFRKKVPEKYQKSQIKELLVEDIMSSNPTSVTKDMSITEVSQIIMETGFNGLPVVEDEKVVGIITQTDILRLIEKLES